MINQVHNKTIATIQDNKKETAIHTAIRYNLTSSFENLLKLGVSDVQDANGDTSLTLAANLMAFDKAMKLAQAGANTNASDKKGMTALHIAILKKNLSEDSLKSLKDLVKVLLENGARGDIQDNDGKTAIQCALEMQREDIANLMIDSLIQEKEAMLVGEVAEVALD